MLDHALQLFKDTSVASIAPTTTYCVKKIATSISFDKADLIVEYGPGDGALTKYLLENMRADAKLIIIETNDHFVSVLRDEFEDPRLTIVHDSAENILDIRKQLGFHKADYIISGIPYSLIPQNVKEEMIKDSSRILKDGGKFIIYQALTAITARRSLKDTVQKHFDTTAHRSYLFNLPPLYVFEALKRKEPLFI